MRHSTKMTFREQMRHEWQSDSTQRHFSSHKKMWALLYVCFSSAVALIAGYKIRPSLDEFPLVVFSGFIYSLEYLSIIGFIWCWVVAQITFGILESRAEARFVQRERLRKPGQSFPVPGFFWSAFAPAACVFLTLASSLFYLLFVLPRYNPVLDRALSSLMPGD